MWVKEPWERSDLGRFSYYITFPQVNLLGIGLEEIMGIVGIYVRTSVDHDNTSIEQQRKLGIKFCNSQKLQYHIYEDVGKSGYKVEDPKEPFKNLPALLKLTEDIESKIIDKVWVFEYSRLSRNHELSMPLIRVFVKHNTTVYERDRQYHFDDPTTKLLMEIMTSVNNFDRNAIIKRTTRGLRDTINTGLRSYNKMYGYKITGIQENGYAKWEAVESEIENIKYSFREYLNGKSVDAIVKALNSKIKNDKAFLHNNHINVLRRFDYTGFSLTTEGSELYKQYKRLELDNLNFLKEKENGKPKYYLPSVNYPLKIVSLDNWLAVAEKLKKNTLVYKNQKRRAKADIFTGIMNCPECNMNYYYYNDKRGYEYYTHYPMKACLQRPKSVKREKINSIVEAFFFYYYLVYDDTKKLLKENQEIVNISLLKVKDKITAVENDNNKLHKQIINLQKIYEDSTDGELVKLTLKKETDLNLKLESNQSVIAKHKLELQELIDEYNRDKMEMTYYNIKDLVVSFFETMETSDKRTALLKIIKKSQFFSVFTVIDTGKILFVFNTEEDNTLPESAYNKFKKDKNYKHNFLNSTSKRSATEEEQLVKWANALVARHLGNKEILEYVLNKKDMKNEMKQRLKKLRITYDLSKIEKVVSFTPEL